MLLVDEKFKATKRTWHLAAPRMHIRHARDLALRLLSYLRLESSQQASDRHTSINVLTLEDPCCNALPDNILAPTDCKTELVNLE